MRSVKFAEDIKNNTVVPKSCYFALIDGRFYRSSATGKVFFTRKCDVVQSLRYSTLYYDVCALADNYMDYQETAGKTFTISDRKKIRKQFWDKFIHGSESRCQFYKVDIADFYHIIADEERKQAVPRFTQSKSVE